MHKIVFTPRILQKNNRMKFFRSYIAYIFLFAFFSAGVCRGAYTWILYYQSHITPSVLSTLRGKEMQAVVYTMMRLQPLSLVQKELDQTFPEELPWMHEIGHYIGESLYKKYGLQAIGMCGLEYNHGCYHGVIQLVARTHGPDPNFLQKLYTACVSQKHSSADCSDPLGHASAILSGFDANKALKMCDEFFTSPNQRVHCGLGMFMEYFNTYASTIFPEGATADKVAHVCDIYPPMYQEGCVELSLTYIYRIYHYTVPQLIQYCRARSESVVIDRCMYAVGAIAAEHYLYDGVTDPIIVCKDIPDYYDSCMVGILRSYQSVHQIWRVPALCPLIVDPNTRASCYLVRDGIQK